MTPMPTSMKLKILDAALHRAGQAGVAAIIAVGQDQDSNNKILQLSARYPDYVYAALGLHPWALGNLNTEQIEQNIDFIRSNLPASCAVGEIGLDYDKRVIRGASKELQKNVLKQLLEIAAMYKKPVSLHSRYAWKDCFQIVKEMGIKSAVFHWYTGFSSTLSEIIESGYFISATPAAEYHEEHRRAVREAPVTQLLLETDSPVHYGLEHKYSSQPADAVRSLKAVASIKGIDENELARQTTLNARRLFGL